MPPLGLHTGDKFGERNVGDIVNWSPEFISIEEAVCTIALWRINQQW